MADSFQFNNNTDKLANSYNKRMVFSDAQKKEYEKILNVFDKDHNGLTNAELNNLWSKMKDAAKGKDANTLDAAEAQKFINENLKNSGVSVNELFKFFKTIDKTLNKNIALYGNNIPPKEKYTPENLEKIYPKDKYRIGFNKLKDGSVRYSVSLSPTQWLDIKIMKDGSAVIEDCLDGKDTKMKYEAADGSKIDPKNLQLPKSNSEAKNITSKLEKDLSKISATIIEEALETYKQNNKTSLFEAIKNNKYLSQSTKNKLYDIINEKLYEKKGLNTPTYRHSEVSNKNHKGDHYYICWKGSKVTLENKTKGTRLEFDLKDRIPNPEDRANLLQSFRELPGEVLEDIYRENITFERKPEENLGEAAAYYSNENEKIVFITSNSINIIAHELGHAIDYNGLIADLPESISGEFLKTFEKEIKAFEQAGHKKNTQNWVNGKPQNTSNKNYTTTDTLEMFAECYSYLMTGKSLDNELLEKYFPECIKATEKLLREIRNKPDWARS